MGLLDYMKNWILGLVLIAVGVIFFMSGFMAGGGAASFILIIIGMLGMLAGSYFVKLAKGI